jgi:hypothetical protein
MAFLIPSIQFFFGLPRAFFFLNYSTWNIQGIRGKMEEITSELGKLKMVYKNRKSKEMY